MNSFLIPKRLSELFVEKANELRSQRQRIVEDWLERCVETWCPKAYQLTKVCMFPEAQQALVDGGFRWTQERLGCDEMLVFWQGEVPLSRVQIDFQLLGLSSKHPAGSV